MKMENEVRLIDANALVRDHGEDVTNWDRPYAVKISSIEAAPAIDSESLAEYLRSLGYEVRKCQH